MSKKVVYSDAAYILKLSLNPIPSAPPQIPYALIAVVVSGVALTIIAAL